MKRIYLILFSVLIAVSACQEDPEIGGTATEAMAGEWFVRLYDAADNTLIIDYTNVMTYNTANNDNNQLWFSDKGNIFDPELRLKVPCDLEKMTFGSGQETVNALDPEAKYVLDKGLIVLKGTKAPSGTVADSIRMELTDTDGSVYILSGYRRTGWPEDGN